MVATRDGNPVGSGITRDGVPVAGSGPPSGAAGGDLGGTYPNPTVVDLTIAGEAHGDILYRNASNWVRLPPGTVNEVLQTNGAAAPSWVGALTLSGNVSLASAGATWTTGSGTGGATAIVNSAVASVAAFILRKAGAQSWAFSSVATSGNLIIAKAGGAQVLEVSQSTSKGLWFADFELNSNDPDFTVGGGGGSPRSIIDRDAATGTGRLEFRADSAQGFTLQVDTGNVLRLLDDGDVTLVSWVQSTGITRIRKAAEFDDDVTVDGNLFANQRKTFSDAAANTNTLGLGTHYAQVGTMTASRILTLSDTTKALASATQPVSFVVFDESGSVTGVNTIVLTPESGNINGGASVAIAVAFGNFEVYTDGTNWFAR